MCAHVCPWWLAYTFDNPLRRLFHNPDRVLGPYVEPGMTTLDLGCGMGHFSLGMAQLVGPEGRVVAVDVQSRMLAILRRRAAKAGLGERIRTHLSDGDSPGPPYLAGRLDFALACWMVHEARRVSTVMTGLAHLLKAGGRFLLIEPKGHVDQINFEQELQTASSAGLEVMGRPKVALSRAAILRRI